MLVGILSDTHDQVRRTKLAVATLEAAGAEGPVPLRRHHDRRGRLRMLRHPQLLRVRELRLRPRRAAEGDRPRSVGPAWSGADIVTLAGRRIAITHGDSEQELRRLAALAA